MVVNLFYISVQHLHVSLVNRSHNLTIGNYFLIHRGTKSEVAFSLYTKIELRRIHYYFVNHSLKSLGNLLKRAINSDELYWGSNASLSKIASDCDIWKRTATALRRFKLTVGADELRFNSIVKVDTMLLGNLPVLHLVEEATNFAATAFLRNQSESDIWPTLQKIWTLTCLGPPDHLWVDKGSVFISKEIMRESLKAAEDTLKEASNWITGNNRSSRTL